MAKTSMVVMIALMMLVSGIAAKKLIVGGDDGWSFPSSDDFYTKWAAKQKFTVGDILVFNFETGDHTVAIVTSKDSYENCDTNEDDNPEEVTEGPYERTLNSSGQFYFFCTIDSHCANGLKFAANVSVPAPSPKSR